MASLISNKKAQQNYEIDATLAAGIELFGHEVKSLRNSLGSLDGAYVIVRGGEAYLIGAYIPAYQPSNVPNSYDDKRPRKLLLNKIEIREISEVESEKGFSIIPLSIYSSGRMLKVEIAIGRGKKKFDKRETLKKRDTEREIRRRMK